jgi:hypothetical protein
MDSATRESGARMRNLIDKATWHTHRERGRARARERNGRKLSSSVCLLCSYNKVGKYYNYSTILQRKASSQPLLGIDSIIGTSLTSLAHSHTNSGRRPPRRPPRRCRDREPGCASLRSWPWIWVTLDMYSVPWYIIALVYHSPGIS